MSLRGESVEHRRLGRCSPSPQEVLLLRACLAADDSAVDAWRRWRAAASPTGVDWRSLTLLPLVVDRLGDSVDDETTDIARRIRRRAWADSQRVTSLVPKIMRAIGTDEPPLVFKGTALAATHYPPGLRSMSDLDMVIGGDRHDQAVDALLADGWTPVDRLTGREVARAMTLATDDGRVLDLHRWPVFPRCTRIVDDGIVERSVPGDGPLAGTCVPAPPDAVVLAILHGLLPTTASAVRWPVDVAIIAANAPDTDDLWDGVEQTAVELGVGHLVGLGLDFCRAELDLDVDAGFCARLRASRLPASIWAEWRLMRFGLQVRSVVRMYIDASRALGRRPTLSGYTRRRWGQFIESGGPAPFIRQRVERAQSTLRAMRR